MKNLKKFTESTLRLFNAVQIESSDRKHNSIFYERMIKNGYIIDPLISCSEELLDTVERIGLSGEKINSSFHKSWSKIKNSSIEQLVAEQIIHYVTTYRFEELGAFDREYIYIPNEIIEIPDANIKLTTIKGLSSDKILEKIIELGCGIALSDDSLDDIMCIIEKNQYNSSFIRKVKNKELKSRLFDFYNLVPDNPEEFLRYLVSKLTEESLLIKNDYLINKIKESNGKFLDVLLKDAPNDLASIFYRFKPLFLAMKSISTNKTFFNKLRKQAVKINKPMKEDYLNSVTSKIKNSDFDIHYFTKEIKNANTFRKIRLAYALKNRINHGDSILYKIRNGSGWVTDFCDKYNWNDCASTNIALKVIISSIASDVGKNIKDKTIYIPEGIHYTLPATEKQFTGNFPTGTYIEAPKDLIAGIHWKNTNKRIDLDLAMIDVSGKIGWDGYYRFNEDKILFSGDMIDAPAPNGASELFYIGYGAKESKILTVNYYNFENGDEVNCKILAAEGYDDFGRNYMVNPSNMIANTNIKISKSNSVIGMIMNVNEKLRFYFSNVSMGNAITSSNDEKTKKTKEFLENTLTNSISLIDILKKANINITNDISSIDENVINLSPESLNKNTIINLFK